MSVGCLEGEKQPQQELEGRVRYAYWSSWCHTALCKSLAIPGRPRFQRHELEEQTGSCAAKVRELPETRETWTDSAPEGRLPGQGK